MDHAYKWGDVFDFVALQVADEVPVDVLRERLMFVSEFLYFVFTKDALAEIIEQLYVGYGLGFAYGDESGS